MADQSETNKTATHATAELKIEDRLVCRGFGSVANVSSLSLLSSVVSNPTTSDISWHVLTVVIDGLWIGNQI
jgi:hypothetical protein